MSRGKVSKGKKKSGHDGAEPWPDLGWFLSFSGVVLIGEVNLEPHGTSRAPPAVVHGGIGPGFPVFSRPRSQMAQHHSS